MSRDIYFITHPDVVADPDVPVTQWPLSEIGQQRMRRLLSADWLSQVDAIYCSTERKAIDGATVLSNATGLAFHLIEALGENDRSATGYLPKIEFEATVDNFFSRPQESIRGWERADAAQSRVITALNHIAQTTPGTGSIAVVAHGGVGALTLCHLKGKPISRSEEQPGSSGGNYFHFQIQLSETQLIHDWRPIDPVTPTPHSEFVHHYSDVNDVRLHYVTLGSGYPVVLLHGWPQTWYEWRFVMRMMQDDFQFFAIDMRGLGESSRPLTGYDKKTVAQDIWHLMANNLRINHFHLVGHDWGSPVAFRLAAEHADNVSKLALLDVPVLGIESVRAGIGRWWHQFHQVADLPEALIYGRERIYLEWFFKQIVNVANTFKEEDIEEYVRAYSQPGAMRAGLNYYRAMSEDVADNQALFQNGFRLKMPCLGLGGGGSRGRGDLVMQSLQGICDEVSGGSIAGSGHFIPEEKPAELVDELRAFFAS